MLIGPIQMARLPRTTMMMMTMMMAPAPPVKVPASPLAKMLVKS
jgi:hypothetical protein